MADENVAFDLEINQTGNARQALREMAEASRTAARAGTDATNELTRAEVLYQSQLRQRGGILATLANQQRSDRSAFGEAQGRQRDNGAGVLYSGGGILGGQRSGYDEARPRVQAEVVMPKIPALRVQVEQPVIPPLIVKQQVQVQYTAAAAQTPTVRATPGDVMGLIGQLPHFGHGGVVTRPTVAVIGEKGPEAVVPLADGVVVGPFYSRLQRALEQQAGSKAVPVEAIKNRLRKTRESFSEEEWAATGMESALAGQRSITMASLLAHHQAKAVRLGEVLKLQKPYPWKGLGEPKTDEEDELRAAFIRNKPRYAKYQTPGGKNYGEMLLTLPLGAPTIHSYTGAEIPAPAYHGTHWDEPNVLAHVRFNDREGPGGEKTLHIEEIQSDWHQQGREKGYFHTGSALGGRTRVPDAPFKDTWHELALKRMLHYAAAGGYERVTLNSGEQINRVLDGPDPGSLPGQQAFYDKMLPNTLAKLIKPLGGKVELANMVSGFPAERGGPRQDTYTDVSSLLLTPEMRKSILEKGFPLLAGGGILPRLEQGGDFPHGADTHLARGGRLPRLEDGGKILSPSEIGRSLIPHARGVTFKDVCNKRQLLGSQILDVMRPHAAADVGFREGESHPPRREGHRTVAGYDWLMNQLLARGVVWSGIPELSSSESSLGSGSDKFRLLDMARSIELPEHAADLLHAASIPEVLARIPAGSQFLGSGVAAVAFRMPDGNVIRLQPAIAEWLNLKRGRRFHPTLLSTDRPNIPGVLPALGQHVAGHGSQAVHMETTPFSPNVPFANKSDEHLAATSKLAALLWQNQYGLQDSHPGNLGMWQKEVVVRDPGSVIHAGTHRLTTEEIEAHYVGLMGVYGELPELRAEWEARKKRNAMQAGLGRPIRGRGGRMRLRESGEASNFLQLADGGVRYRDDLQHFQSLVAAGFSNEESHRIMRRKPGDRPQPASMDPPSIAGIQLPQVPHRSMLDKIMDFAYMAPEDFLARGGRMPRLAGGFSWPRVPRLPFGEAASPGHLAQIMERQLAHEEAPDDIRHAMNLLKASSTFSVMRHVPEASTFLGAGIAAVAFRMPDGNVIRLQPAIAEWLNAKRGARLFPSIFNTERPKIKGVLPALGSHVEGSGAHAVHLEITPFSPNVAYRGHSDAHLADQARLERILERQGYGLQDSHPGNLGIYQGKTVVRDPGSVFLLTATKDESLNPFLPRQKMMTPLQWAEHYEKMQQQFGIIPELQSQYADRLRARDMQGATVRSLPRLAKGVKLPFQSKAKVETHWNTNPAFLHANLQSILGTHVGIDDLASLVGAPEGATVLAGNYASGDLWVNTYGPGFHNSRTFGKDQFGKPYIYNSGFFVEKGMQGEGLGKTIFGQQVGNAQALGVSYLKTHAARSGKPPMAGYYTWPRFGYDQSIDEMANAGYAYSTAVMNRTKQRFPRAKSILDVFDAGGKEWWKQQGWDLFDMKFDLAHGSRSMETWQKYLAEKKQPKVSLPGMMASPLFGIGGRGIGALPKLEGGGVGAETPSWLQMIAAQNARLAAENPNDDRFKLRPAQTLAERLAKKTTQKQDEQDAWLDLYVRLEHGRNRLGRRKEAVTELQLPGREAEFQAYLRFRQHHREADLYESAEFSGQLGAPLFLGLAQGGHTSGGLRAIAGEAGPERFHSRGQDYLLTRPTLITMHPGDFVQPRGKRIEDLPQLARGGGMGTFSMLPGLGTDRPQPVIITGPFPLLVRDARGGGQSGQGSGQGGGQGGIASILGLPEGLNKFTGAATVATLAIGAVERGLGFASGVMNTLGDSTLSGSQKMRMWSESIPVVGGVVKAFREFSDALSGIPDKLHRLTMANEKDMARRAAFHGGAETFRGHLFETQSQLAKATTLQHAVLPAQGPTARGTYQEELLYKRSQELLPAREAIPVAQAEAHAAQVVHGGAVVLRQEAQERIASLERNLVLGQQRVDALKVGVGNLSASENSLAIQKELMAMQADAAALDREHQSLLTATNREKEAGVAMERAESGVRKANIELAKSELGVLQQKEQRLASQATTVGAMSEGQKRRALSIADQVERGGYDSLTLRQKETLRGFAPQYARKEDERIGEGSFVTERLKQVNIFERGALRETRQQFDQKQQEVRVAIKFDHERLAAGMTHAMERVTDILIAAAHDAAVYAERQRSIAQQIMAAGIK